MAEGSGSINFDKAVPSQELKGLAKEFYEFFETYTKDNEKYYRRKIKTILDKDQKSLVIDCRDLAVETDLVQKVIENPDLAKENILDAVDLIWKERKTHTDRKAINIRFKNLPTKNIPIKELQNTELGRLISIEGVITKVSQKKDFLSKIQFYCTSCGADGKELERPQKPYQKLKRPTRCPMMDCGAGKNKIKPNYSESDEKPWQKLQIQESPEKVRGSRTPEDIDVILVDDLVYSSNFPDGSRVRITGVLELVPPDNLNSKPLGDRVLIGNNIEILEKELEEIKISNEDKERIKEIANKENSLEMIKNSIAPVIRGRSELKKALGLTIFGGSKFELPDGSELRGNSNVLIIGDPGTGKSVILKSIERIIPRGLYTSGKSSTEAGLTAAAVRDEFTGDWSLRAGALVKSDGGICAIDEFDKMDGTDRSSIHEAMEQGTVNISKAGITATLKAETSIIAGANPRHGRFEKYKPVSDQVKLSPTLLSRFDLIFKIMDEANVQKDGEIADHVLGVRKDKSRVDPDIGEELLRKYIAFARQEVNPTMTEEAIEKIKKYYVEMRQVGEDSENSPIPITARQLESLIRLAEAHARINLREKVTSQDADRVIGLMDEVLKDMGMDPVTKELDIDLVMTGTSKSQREKIDVIVDIIRHYMSNRDDSLAPVQAIIDDAVESDIEKDETRHLLQKMKENKDIIEPKKGYYKIY